MGGKTEPRSSRPHAARAAAPLRKQSRPRPASRRRREPGPEILAEHRQGLEPDIYLIDCLATAPVRAPERKKIWKPRPRFGLRLAATVLVGAAAAALVLPSLPERISGVDQQDPAVLSSNDPTGKLAAELLEGDLPPPATAALAEPADEDRPVAR